MTKIFLIYGHYNEKSFNAAIRDTFIESAKNSGHHIDLLDLYKENFNPVFAGEEPDTEVLDHRKRIEACDTIVLIAPIWNLSCVQHGTIQGIHAKSCFEELMFLEVPTLAFGPVEVPFPWLSSET